MAKYSYRVLDKDGKKKKGEIEANTEDKASEKLKAEGYTVIQVGLQGAMDKDIQISIGGGVKSRDLSVFCKQFVSVLNAGVTIITALDMLAEQMPNKKLQQALKETQAYVEKGGSLAGGFALNPKVFPPILINMVAAGESSGSMEIAFERLSTHFEKDAALKGKIKGALTYPAVVCVVAIIVVVVMLLTVVPTFADMFLDMGVKLPFATRALIAASHFLAGIGGIVSLIAVIGAIVGLKMFKKTPTGDLVFSTIAIKIPVIGNLTVQSCSARFARTLSTLMAAGIPLLDAIEQVAKMMGNKIFCDGLMDAKTQVSKGVPLSKPLKDMGVFPPMLTQMVKIGEETGNIEDMMEKVADYYDSEVDLATGQLTAAMEPFTIVILAVVVGGIVAAVYGPMLTMYNNMDNL